MSGLVQGVLTQEGRDISALINAAAAANKSEPVGLLAGLISESDLRERAARYGRHSAEAEECIRVLIEAGEWP